MVIKKHRFIYLNQKPIIVQPKILLLVKSRFNIKTKEKRIKCMETEILAKEGLCRNSRLFAAIVEKNAKYLFNQKKAGLYIAETATQSTKDKTSN